MTHTVYKTYQFYPDQVENDHFAKSKGEGSFGLTL